MADIQVRQVTTRGDLRAFVLFPWSIYRGDPNWVPPLVSDRLQYLDPATGPFYRQAEVALFLAQRGRRVVGTIASFVDHQRNEHLDQQEGGFGFFETVQEYPVAERLLDTACAWLRARGLPRVCGPTSFGEHEWPGVLVAGADCPPAMLEAHTPPYYKDFLERYGMAKDHDLYAWRASCEQIGEELKNIPPELVRVAEVARRAAKLTLRKVNLKEWDREVSIVRDLFNTTLQHHLPNFVPMSESDFRRFASQMRPFLDPDLMVIAEVEGKPIGFCVAIPDVNQVLIRLNGRLFPFGWLKVARYIRRIDVVSFKLMGVLEEYRHRGIDALLYMETIRAVYEKGYRWLDGSLSSELNLTVNLVAQRLGAELYKQYRLYQMAL